MEAAEIAARVLLRAGVPPKLVTAGYEARQQMMLAFAKKTASSKVGSERQMWTAAIGSGDFDVVECLLNTESALAYLENVACSGYGLTAAQFYACLPVHLYAWPYECPEEWGAELAACLCDTRPPLTALMAHMREVAARGL